MNGQEKTYHVDVSLLMAHPENCLIFWREAAYSTLYGQKIMHLYITDWKRSLKKGKSPELNNIPVELIKK